jgi:hypothetical protein
MLYIIYIPILFIIIVISSWLSVKLNSTNKSTWLIILYGLSLIQVWPFVAKFSKDIIFDALLYDILVVLIYTFSIIYFSKHFSITIGQYIGVGFIFLGLIVFKLTS